MLVGGEAFRAALAKQLAQLVKGSLINVYGPTETTVWSSSQRVSGVDGEVPIGRPLANGIGPVVSPTMSIRNGGSAGGPISPISEAPFITSWIPASVESTASGKATMLTCSDSDPAWAARRAMGAILAERCAAINIRRALA
jgi:hypothetical protein